MAKVINVLLEVENGKSYNLNQMGLVSFSFDRFIGSTANVTSGILTEFEMVLFDSSGFNIISILQANKSNLKVRYGFDDKMSSIYVLTMTKLNTTFNNMGIMVTVGGIGTQSNQKFSSTFFKEGTKISTILEGMAQRNGWNIGSGDNRKDYINCDIRLSQGLLKTQNESDFEFIVNKLKPLANKSVYVTGDINTTVLYDVNLVSTSARPSLYFRPSTYRGTTKRVWKYGYGSSTNSKIISLTNRLDLSFLIDGLYLKIPVTEERTILLTDEQAQAEVEEIIASKIDVVNQMIEDYSLISLDPSEFEWKIELVATEDIGNISYEDMILNKLEDVMSVINKIELEVEGNPDILPTDLLELTVKNKDGSINIISSSTTGSSYWKIIGITESIGMDAYTTKLTLVRDINNNV